MMKGKPAFDPSIEWVCVCGFCGGEKGELVAVRGQHYAGTNPVVAAAPHYFVPASTPVKGRPSELSFIR